MNDAENRFIAHNNGTVSDRQTGLMWTATDSMNDLKKWVNYQDGVDYARHLRETAFAGYDDWRLPTRDEVATLYVEDAVIKDYFGKDIHLDPAFSPGGGFSMIAQLVSGRIRTWVFNLRDGEFTQPDGLWTLSEAARAVRRIRD